MSQAEAVQNLIKQSLDRDEGDEQISLSEQAVRLADLGGDLEIQYYAREVFVRACIVGGAPEKALVAFAWLLAQFDNNPGRFNQWAILWKYKWINSVVCEFPQVPKSRIYAMLDDLERRSLKAGYGLRAVNNLRYRAERFWDNKEQAGAYFRKLTELSSDDLNDCAACEINERVGFAIYCGNDEQALNLAVPILNDSKKCGSVPHRTYANLLLPLIRLGRPDDALRLHLKGYRLIRNNKVFLAKIADHMICLALTENLREAVVLFENHYRWTDQSRDAFGCFQFFRASWLLFEVMAERQESIVLNMPHSAPLYVAGGDYDLVRLATWFKQAAEALAGRFDERNETDFFARTLVETAALKERRIPFPLIEPAIAGKDENDQPAVAGGDPRLAESGSQVPPPAWFDYIASVYYEKGAFPVADGNVELLTVNWQYELLFYVGEPPLLTNVVSQGDIVEMEWIDEEIIPRFKRVVEASGRRTVRVDVSTADNDEYFCDFLAALKSAHPNYRHENKLVTFAIEDQRIDKEIGDWLDYLHVSWVYTDTSSRV